MAVILTGHGTTLNEDSGAPIRQHVLELQRRRCFGEIHPAFLKQEPRIVDVLGSVRARKVVVVPFFISEGYFSDVVLPGVLGFAKRREGEFIRTQTAGEQILIYTKPIGTHEEMTEVLLSRAQSVVARFPFPVKPAPSATTLFIAGHGTPRNADSRKSIDRKVDLLRAKNLYAEVHPIFMEESPRIGECYAMARSRHIVIVPFFTSDGLHVREDIPLLLGETEANVRKRLETGVPTWRNPTERNQKLVWLSDSAGTDPRVADVIVDLVCDSLRFPA